MIAVVHFQSQNKVGEIVAIRPDLARVFEEFHIDYCCGGKMTLGDACQRKGVDPHKVLSLLNTPNQSPAGDLADTQLMAWPLGKLVTHIEQTHHVYLKTEFPRLDALTQKVVAAHGPKDSRLQAVRKAFIALVEELTPHMMKEERILFPMIRELEQSTSLPQFHCGSLANPIRQMEREHVDAGAILEEIDALTDNFVPPTWACNTYRVMLDALKRLEVDLHLHIHKENNILFPNTLKLESQKQPG